MKYIFQKIKNLKLENKFNGKCFMRKTEDVLKQLEIRTKNEIKKGCRFYCCRFSWRDN